jgi:hypothetical protein
MRHTHEDQAMPSRTLGEVLEGSFLISLLLLAWAFLT